MNKNEDETRSKIMKDYTSHKVIFSEKRRVKK